MNLPNKAAEIISQVAQDLQTNLEHYPELQGIGQDEKKLISFSSDLLYVCDKLIAYFNENDAVHDIRKVVQFARANKKSSIYVLVNYFGINLEDAIFWVDRKETKGMQTCSMLPNLDTYKKHSYQ